MKNNTFILTLILICVQAASSQTSLQFTLNANGGKEELTVMACGFPEDQDDPAFKIYKTGYDLILDERWEDARKKFADIISKYPKSKYIDHASYWSAYALKNIDRKKAIDAYDTFIKKFPKSRFYDDAIADFAELKKDKSKILKKLTVTKSARVYVTEDGIQMTEGKQAMKIREDGIVIGEGPDSVVLNENGITIRSDGKSFSYGYSFAPRAFERALRIHANRLSRMTVKQFADEDQKNLDPEMRLKIDALYAIGETKENDQSFQTLKEIALDFRQPGPLRKSALFTLADFKKYDVLPIFLDVAKKDSNDEIQILAIDFICRHDRDKEKTATILIDLFNSIPKERDDQRQMIFYSIADIGNERTVDFLSKVALADEDYEMRREAIYYLSSIGSEKARAVLIKILQSK